MLGGVGKCGLRNRSKGESTQRAVKYRRDSEIIIMIHDGRGWFDPLSEAKGDVLPVAHLYGGGFAAR